MNATSRIVALAMLSTPALTQIVEDGVVSALDREGAAVVPLSCDYAIWTERAGRRAEEFAAFAPSDSQITPKTDVLIRS